MSKTPSEGPHPDAVTGELALERIRDLLFGEQARTVEDRLRAAEGKERDLHTELQAFRQETEKQFDGLGRQALAFEKKAAEDVAALATKVEASLAALRKDLDDRLRALAEKVEKGLASADEKTVREARELRGALDRVTQEAHGALESATAELRARSVDRAGASALFSELAARIAEESGKPRGA